MQSLWIWVFLMLVGSAHAADPRVLTIPSQNDVQSRPTSPIAPTPSQPPRLPSPSITEQGGVPEQSPAVRPSQQTVTDQRSTENAPEKVLPAQKVEGDAAEQGKRRWDERALAIATVVLAGIAGAQALLFLWQLKLMNKATEDAAKSAAAAKDAADAAKTQSEIAKTNLALSQRPLLRVGKVVMTHPDVMQSPFFFREGDIISGDCEIINVGSTTATITDVWSVVYWTNKGLPMLAPYDGTNPQYHGANPDPRILLSPSLSPGFSTTLKFKSDHPMEGDAKAITNRNDRWRLYIMGLIYYVDNITPGGRRNYFCREWQIDPYRFQKVENSDYEAEN